MDDACLWPSCRLNSNPSTTSRKSTGKHTKRLAYFLEALERKGSEYGAYNSSCSPQLLTRNRPKLLGIPDTVIDDNEQISQDAHDDERQIRLDTDRSFVLYPVGELRRYASGSSF